MWLLTFGSLPEWRNDQRECPWQYPAIIVGKRLKELVKPSGSSSGGGSADPGDGQDAQENAKVVGSEKGFAFSRFLRHQAPKPKSKSIWFPCSSKYILKRKADRSSRNLLWDISLPHATLSSEIFDWDIFNETTLT